eukprot:365389-Chlamydomonas_euryale.AAC.4
MVDCAGRAGLADSAWGPAASVTDTVLRSELPATPHAPLHLVNICAGGHCWVSRLIVNEAAIDRCLWGNDHGSASCLYYTCTTPVLQ